MQRCKGPTIGRRLTTKLTSLRLRETPLGGPSIALKIAMVSLFSLQRHNACDLTSFVSLINLSSGSVFPWVEVNRRFGVIEILPDDGTPASD